MKEELEGILGSAMLDQVDVFKRSIQIAKEERSLHYFRLETLFSVSVSAQQPLHAMRAAQVACAWLPESLDIVAEALESLSPEVRFPVLCSITDVDELVIELVQSRLAPLVWHSVVNSKNTDVEYIGVKALLRFQMPLVRDLVSGTNKKKISGFLRDLLKEGGAL